MNDLTSMGLFSPCAVSCHPAWLFHQSMTHYRDCHYTMPHVPTMFTLGLYKYSHIFLPAFTATVQLPMCHLSCSHLHSTNCLVGRTPTSTCHHHLCPSLLATGGLPATYYCVWFIPYHIHASFFCGTLTHFMQNRPGCAYLPFKPTLTSFCRDLTASSIHVGHLHYKPILYTKYLQYDIHSASTHTVTVPVVFVVLRPCYYHSVSGIVSKLPLPACNLPPASPHWLQHASYTGLPHSAHPLMSVLYNATATLHFNTLSPAVCCHVSYLNYLSQPVCPGHSLAFSSLHLAPASPTWPQTPYYCHNCPMPSGA